MNITQDNQQNKSKSANIFNQFNGDRKAFNIFGQKQNDNDKKNIFCKPEKSVNLFNVLTVPASNNIFKSQSKPLIKNVQDDDEKSSSNSNSQNSSVVKEQQQSQFKQFPQKMEMKYAYQNKWNVLKKYNLRKFKNGFSPSKEQIYMTFEKHSDHPDRVHVLVRSYGTKILLFQAIGIKGLTNKATSFANKDQNVKITVLKSIKSQNQECKLVKEQLKIQFETSKQAQQFKVYLQEVFGQIRETKEQ